MSGSFLADLPFLIENNIDVAQHKAEEGNVVSKLSFAGPACPSSRAMSTSAVLQSQSNQPGGMITYRKLNVPSVTPCFTSSDPARANTGSSKEPPKGAYGCAMIAKVQPSVGALFSDSLGW